ncbi:hypothetical protein [Streptacidiphilus sp. P02-A3a]|uniref:hypothetical protein n=1 Tax=Streptacidiphilus sp. P02-A3a TaxID=2704468 RepID=UPI0015F9BC0C|nr:hypothetical protein [Streptacidiphilus sp. P02-A3a]QMU72121.1 hypothetical protein GXP74_31670 [Streptacidiphilus sp. P02-A3a]
MDTLTIEDVRAAQAQDIDGISAVIAATEGRVYALADKAARRMSETGDRFAEYRDEFRQVGRIAVWESLPRFAGDDVDSFFALVHSTVDGVLLDAVRDARYGGVGADKDALKIFGQMLGLSGGDVHLAEKLSQTVPPKGRRLGVDRASAARMAWAGALSLDVPTSGADPTGRADDCPTSMDALSEALELPADLITSDDIGREERRRKNAMVRGVLDVMGDGQAAVLRASFGINGPLYGYGADHNDEELAADLGTTVVHVRDARTKGMRAFGRRWVKLTARDADHAEELTAAQGSLHRRGPRGGTK